MPESVTAPLAIEGPEGLHARVGEELGASDWLVVSQAEIDAFAAATGDHQWIHVDVEQARASAAGTTIAHGLLTLSLGPRFNDEIFAVTGFAQALNYGYEKVRFPAPVPAGERLRMRAQLLSATDVAGGVQTVVRQTYELGSGGKPACVADAVTRWVL